MSVEWIEAINQIMLIFGFVFGFFFWGVACWLIFGK